MSIFLLRCPLAIAIVLSAFLFITACGDEPNSDNTNGSDDSSQDNNQDNQSNQSNQDNQDNQSNQDSCTDPCTAGATRCSADGVQSCVSIDGCAHWADPVACNEGQVCSGGQCGDECQVICADGDQECLGDDFRVCELNNDGCWDWAAPQSCPDGGTCSEGLCEGCQDGSRRCSLDSATIEQCSSNTWSPVQSCPLGCEDAACAVQVSCQPGAYQCNGLTVEVCNASGSAFLHISTCAVGCTAGLCTGECTPGEARCNGDDVEICNPSGTTWDVDETCDNRCEPSIAACAADSLDITTDTNLDGTVVVDGPFTVRSGASVFSPTGNLTIIASSITVEEGGSITVAATGDNPEGRGSDGGYDSFYVRGSGGSGASYGTRGQDGYWQATAPSPHARADEIHVSPGSRGGNGYGGEGFGGAGGGLLRLHADQINVSGSLRADGQSGSASTNSCTTGDGGAGSGGAILLAADELLFSGTISVQGGARSSVYCTTYNYGGAGGDGIIKFLYGSSYEDTGTISGAFYSGLLAPLRISSSTHPDPDLYYNDDFDVIALSWERPFESLQGYYHTLNDSKHFVPTPSNAEFLDDEVTSYSRDDVTNGSNFFHITAVDVEFNHGTMEARRDIKINTLPPSLSSASHGNQHTWSTNNNVYLQWTDQRDEANFTGYYYTVDHFGDTVPTTDDTLVPISQKQTLLSSLADGIWAFHIVPIDTMGYLTKEAATYRVRIGDDPGNGTILGTIRDDNNDPVEGATITLNRGLLHPATPDQITNASGNYNFTTVPAGQWEVRVEAEGFQPKDIDISLDPDQSRTVDVTLDPL